LKLYSTQTSIGAACLVSIEAPIHHVDAPEGWGLIFWGRCDRTQLLTIALNAKAAWIADFDINQKVAIVVYPLELTGKILEIDTSCVEAICPGCGSTKYTSSGVNWRCSVCDRQWRKNPGRRGRPIKST
jgi:hypothetical protein